MTATTEPPSAKPTAIWKDGDTMLSFGLFAVVVLVMLVLRIADPDNWIAVAAAYADALPLDVCGRGGHDH